MSKQRIALYDENCSLCQATKKNVMKRDWFHRIQWTSLQEYEKSENAISFQAVDLRRELHLLVLDGQSKKVLKGFRAVRHILRQLPITFLLGCLCYIPGVSYIGEPLYKWVAKRRYHLLKSKCDSDQCAL